MPLPKNVLALLLVAASPGTQAVWGQAKTGGSTGAPSGTSGGKTGIPTIGTPNTTPTNTSTPTMAPPPIYVTGRVLLEDGTPPPQEVVIERVCGTQIRAEGYTDSKGYFGVNIAFGNNPTQMASTAGLEDASENSGYGTRMPGGGTGGLGGGSQQATGMGNDMRLASCELRAKLGGYRSQSVNLVDRRALDNPDIGVILLHRMIGPAGGTAVSASLLAVPKDARRAYEKGQEAAKKEKINEAIKNYEKAVELYPKFAVAWCEMGILQASHGADENAHKSFDEAVRADPKYVTPYLQLSLMEMSAHNWQPLADVTAQAIKLDPFSYPIAHFFNAVANFNLGNLGPAELEARQTEKLDTRHEFPRASHLLGMILAQRHDYLGAADELRTYLKLAPNSPEASGVRAQLEEVEKMGDSAMPQVVKEK
jgi:tetratricopeptide (TPR) repeat protein